VAEESQPGGAIAALPRQVMTGENPANHVFINLSVELSLPKMLSGANTFEISDIERMNIGAHQPGT
jgi:hypothetical protein